MGLDITVLGKPLPGREAEYDDLLRSLAIAQGLMPDIQRPTGLLQRLFGGGRPRMTEAESARKTERFQAISTPPYAVLGAPVVGRDAAADVWVAKTAVEAGKNPNEALAEMAGFHVLALVAECDGLPVYTHGNMGYHVDLTSFRGAFLNFCTQALPKAERSAAWTVMTAPELLAYGQRLADHARRYAEMTGLSALLGQRLVEWEKETSPEAQLHITDSLARWAIFWGSRGHGAYPDF